MKIFVDMIRATEREAYINGIPAHESKRSALANFFGDLAYVSWL